MIKAYSGSFSHWLFGSAQFCLEVERSTSEVFTAPSLTQQDLRMSWIDRWQASQTSTEISTGIVQT